MFKFKNPMKDSFFDNIDGKKLDKYQRKIILDNSNHLLVVAGAGSGKTLTILGKIKYLIEKQHIKQEEILCLSFTNETVNNLKERLPYQVDVFTFHKLAINILKKNCFPYHIMQNDLLSYIVNEYFYSFASKNDLFSYFGSDKSIEEILASEELIILKRNIISFIQKVKCNNWQINSLQKLKKQCLKIEEKQFLYFALSVFVLYQEELLSTLQIDFDDMIIYAKDFVSKTSFSYRYIIVDEYQDISYIRFLLLYEILEKTQAKLMCVGDDYQAIYGFSGSNIALFFNFLNFFPNAKRLDIKNTYRNSYELIRTSVRFVKKNPYQLRKNIHATFLYKNPIVLVYYDNDYLEKYNDLLNYLYMEEEKNILVLSRYNEDLTKIKKEEHKGLSLRYLTVHMAKGLESDNVILLRVSDDYLGFPSKIKNASLLDKIDELKEMEYAEERRLFYVALTRCRKRIYLLVPRNNPSSFVQEIKNDCVELLLNKE